MFSLYLKDPKSSRTTAIRLRVYLKGKPHHYSTGESIYPDAWDTVEQRCKTGVKFPMAQNTNLRLGRIIQAAGLVKSRFDTDGVKPTWPQFKAALDIALDRGTDEGIGFWTYVDRLMHNLAASRPELTKGLTRNSILTSYRQTYNLLRSFEATFKKLEWETFDGSFYVRFVDYCQRKRGYGVNNTGKHIKTLKTWLNAGLLDGVNTGLYFKRYKVLSERTAEVYLTRAEIDGLIGLDLHGQAALIRDIFVFACYTGLRYVDYTSVKKSAIHDGNLYLHQSKTGSPVIIPLRPECLNVLNRYGGELPKPPENQTMNKVLKELAFLSGIDKSKADKVKTHTARRSFATNLYLENFPSHDIMKITGHKSEKSFLLYIRMAPAEAARRLSEHWKL